MSASPEALRAAAARLRSHAGELERAAGSLRLAGDALRGPRAEGLRADLDGARSRARSIASEYRGVARAMLVRAAAVEQAVADAASLPVR